MRRFAYAVAIEAAGTTLQDRAAAFESGDVLVVALADGAGGAGPSERAAEAVLRGVEALATRGAPLLAEETWADLLAELDEEILRAGVWGETTAVVLAVGADSVCGASVGDSEAWVATADGFDSLTAGQRRKPLLGSGAAWPVTFRRAQRGGTLVVGSDGLFKYAPIRRVCDAARAGPPAEAARALVELVRLPRGGLPDDVAVVVCAPAHPTTAPAPAPG